MDLNEGIDAIDGLVDLVGVQPGNVLAHVRTSAAMVSDRLVNNPSQRTVNLRDYVSQSDAVGFSGQRETTVSEFISSWLVRAVPCVGDVNGDGLLTPADFNAWIIAFNTSAPECDQNGDGFCTPADFNAWVLNFNAGC